MGVFSLFVWLRAFVHQCDCLVVCLRACLVAWQWVSVRVGLLVSVVCVCVCLLVVLFGGVVGWLCVCLFGYWLVCVVVCVFVSLYVCLFVCLFVCVLVCLIAWLSVRSFGCLCV